MEAGDMLLQLNSPGEGTPRDSSKAAAPPGEEVGGEEANDEVREGILVSFDDTAAPRVDQRVVLSKASDENDDTPPGGEDLREASSGSNQMDDEDEWETVQEQRPFCAAGPDCTSSGSILEAEHYVTYRHTALNRKERQAMEERKEIEGHGVKAQEVKKEDKKAGPRLIDFLGRKKDSDKKVDKKDAPIKEREETSLKPAEPQSATGSSGSSPTKGKDTASAGFTLKKIFGRKDEDTADEPTVSQSVILPMVSPTLTGGTELEPATAVSASASTEASVGQGARSGDTAVGQVAGASWLATTRTTLTEKIEEVKRKMQTSNLDEEHISDRLATFKKAAEELDALEKELEQILAMGDSFTVWQSQKKKILEVTSRGEIVSCDLLYQSPFINDWQPISQQINFKSSLLSTGPSYAYCRVRLLTPDGKQIDSMDELPRDSQPLYEVKLATAIRYIDEIRSFGIDERAKAQKVENASRGMSFKVEWKNGSREQWFAEDGEGFAKVVYYHLRAYNLRRAKQVGRLRGLWCLACTSYDSTDKQHESELMALWTAVLPDVKLSGRITSQWKQLGFQGNDPATDFRGMGLLGLTTLLYFARHYTETVATLLKQGRSYPWASAGINLTQMLFKSLKLDEALIRSADSSDGWDTPLFLFMTSKENEAERNLFEEIFCELFQLFDRIWVLSNAGYMDFPNIVAKVTQMFEEILQQRPNNIANLHQRLLLACERL